MHLHETFTLFLVNKSWFGRPADFDDAVLREEIELVGDVIAAAGSYQGRLSPAQVDLALGLDASPARSIAVA